MSKTIGEWLKELPKDVRKKAMDNVQELEFDPEETLNEDVRSLGSAIGSAFIWSDSPEGLDYWSKIKSKFNH